MRLVWLSLTGVWDMIHDSLPPSDFRPLQSRTLVKKEKGKIVVFANKSDFQPKINSGTPPKVTEECHEASGAMLPVVCFASVSHSFTIILGCSCPV